MTLRDIYPFWPETHDEILDRLSYIMPGEWDERPCSLSVGSIRQIVARLVRDERQWIGEIVLGREPYEMPSPSAMSSDDLISELRAARALTERALADRSIGSLREVRTAPADPVANEIARNVPISYVIWRILEFELVSWGQIQLRLSQ